jgi:site-specific DNA recombinase
MKQAIGYIRVSTEQQADEGVSLDAQRAKISAWCMVNDYELVDVQVDAGISGRRMKNRQGLQKALSQTKKGMALVVYSLSRMSRSVKDTLAISEQLDKVGADLVSLSEKIDTTGAAGKMLFRMLAVIAEFESDVNSERTISAMSQKKAMGEKYAHIPFGYSELEGRLVQVEAEALVVAEIVKQRGAGDTLQSIAQTLNERGIIGKQGGKWYASSVRCILQRQLA